MPHIVKKAERKVYAILRDCCDSPRVLFHSSHPLFVRRPDGVNKQVMLVSTRLFTYLIKMKDMRLYMRWPNSELHVCAARNILTLTRRPPPTSHRCTDDSSAAPTCPDILLAAHSSHACATPSSASFPARVRHRARELMHRLGSRSRSRSRNHIRSAARITDADLREYATGARLQTTSSAYATIIEGHLSVLLQPAPTRNDVGEREGTQEASLDMVIDEAAASPHTSPLISSSRDSSDESVSRHRSESRSIHTNLGKGMPAQRLREHTQTKYNTNTYHSSNSVKNMVEDEDADEDEVKSELPALQRRIHAEADATVRRCRLHARSLRAAAHAGAALSEAPVRCVAETLAHVLPRVRAAVQPMREANTAHDDARRRAAALARVHAMLRRRRRWLDFLEAAEVQTRRGQIMAAMQSVQMLLMEDAQDAEEGDEEEDIAAKDALTLLDFPKCDLTHLSSNSNSSSNSRPIRAMTNSEYAHRANAAPSSSSYPMEAEDEKGHVARVRVGRARRPPTARRDALKRYIWSVRVPALMESLVAQAVQQLHRWLQQLREAGASVGAAALAGAGRVRMGRMVKSVLIDVEDENFWWVTQRFVGAAVCGRSAAVPSAVVRRVCGGAASVQTVFRHMRQEDWMRRRYEVVRAGHYALDVWEPAEGGGRR